MLRDIIQKIIKYFSVKEVYLKECRRRWGKTFETYRSETDTTSLFNLTTRGSKVWVVDDGTWNDLDMDGLFDRIDNTITLIGRQYLYRQLRTCEANENALQSHYRTAAYYRSNTELRESTQLVLMGLRGSGAALMTVMLFGKLPAGKFPALLAWCMAGFSIISILVAVFFPVFFWLPVFALLANFVFSETYSHEIGRDSISFGYLKKLLVTAGRLSRLNPPQEIQIEQFEFLQNNSEKIKELEAEFRISGLDSTSNNVSVAQLAFILNLVCLFDFLIYLRSTKRLARHHDVLVRIFNSVASIDSAISVGSYLVSVNQYCNPVFSADTEVHFDDVVHPMLDGAVANSFTSHSDSALITGSNMAGKSTFIKTLGVNIILAQTLWICHATSAKLSRIPVMSSIKRSDSLKHGKSYYFTEIEALQRLIDARDSGYPHVFLIDEILHGTNTVERIASAYAILDYLSEKNIVLVTSHDVELTNLLPERFNSFHFRETSDPENMFDYKMHDGHSTSRNAITLLEAIGFPSEIISAARKTASESQA